MRHMMIDTETLSLRPNAVVTAIGVVVFDTQVASTYSAVISDTDEQVNRGCHIDTSTVFWWMTQSEEARNVFKYPNATTRQALEMVTQIYMNCSVEQVWCKGAAFDFPVLENLFRLWELVPPWKYRQRNCFSTLLKHFHVEIDTPSVPHDALADAVAQATTCMKILRNIS